MSEKKSKHVLAFEENHLKPGEEIKFTAKGYIGKMMGSGDDAQHNGELIVTDKRVSFYKKGMFGSEVLESISLDKVSSVDRRSTMGFHALVIHTSNNAIEFKTGDKNIAQAVTDYFDNFQPQKLEPTKPAELSPIEKIKQLAELRDAGLISEDEFNEKKAKLLAAV